MKDERTCIDIIGVDRCTGCFGCQTACRDDAIHLVLDAEGFYTPVVNRGACTHCGLCQRRCPVIAYDTGRLPIAEKWAEPKAFAAWSLDEPLRLNSSSGGVFSELARPVIAAGGVVAGCAWGADWTPEHILAHNWPEVEKMRGSKYVPSKVGNTFPEIEKYLRSNPGPALFVGTPCQVAALELALNREQRKRVLLVDLICDGVPSLRVFHRYLRELFDGESVVSYLFREKSCGWEASSVRAESASQRHHHVRVWCDPFVAGSQAHRLFMMAACHKCAFARLPRAGDITLGDFWGCPDLWSDRRGVSAALANTPDGLRALESLGSSGRICLKPTDLATVAKGNQRLVAGVYPMPESRRTFLDGIVAGKPFGFLWSKYGPKIVPTWRSWLLALRDSDAKVQFVSASVLRRLHRIARVRT